MLEHSLLQPSHKQQDMCSHMMVQLLASLLGRHSCSLSVQHNMQLQSVCCRTRCGCTLEWCNIQCGCALNGATQHKAGDNNYHGSDKPVHSMWVHTSYALRDLASLAFTSSWRFFSCRSCSRWYSSFNLPTSNSTMWSVQSGRKRVSFHL